MAKLWYWGHSNVVSDTGDIMIVQLSELSKSYGAVQALQKLSLTIEAGEFVGLVGPNGAGKSTTIQLLTAQLMPTSGTVEICGLDATESPNEVRHHIGYVPEFPKLYDYLTAEEMISFVAEIRGKGDVAWALELTGLGADAQRPIQGYSQGMRRKTAIACALVAKPELIVLDESLNGLDPPSVERVLNALEELRQEGCAILLSTHVLDTLERLATRIVLLGDGQLQGDWPGNEISAVRAYFQRMVEGEESSK